jgi:hypothetical protein
VRLGLTWYFRTTFFNWRQYGTIQSVPARKQNTLRYLALQHVAQRTTVAQGIKARWKKVRS